MTDSETINNYNKLSAVEQLNLFRNLYYTDGNCTERGIIANALNEILPQLALQKSEIERLKSMNQAKLDTIHDLQSKIERLEQETNEAVSCFHRMESLYNIKCMELKVAKTERIDTYNE